jgi:hypothetical protein
MSTGWTQPGLAFPGTFPYAGTSGYAAGSDTSEDRAREDDESGATTRRQRAVLALVGNAQDTGLTWAELADLGGWHHGQASGALSALHKSGLVAMLTDRRQRSHVYVLPAYVADRPTQPHGSNRHGPTRLVLSADAVTEALADAGLTGRDAARARNALRALGLELTR